MLSGSVPTTLGNIPALTILHLSRNNLEGILTSYCSFSHCTRLLGADGDAARRKGRRRAGVGGARRGHDGCLRGQLPPRVGDTAAAGAVSVGR